MIVNFPRHRQQTGWSCLPSAVLCVLEYSGFRAISMDQVARWCRIEPGGGCVWHRSIDGLRNALQGEFDIEVLDGDWEAVRAAVETNDEPVIVNIANPNPRVQLLGTHAVVVIRFEFPEGGEEQVVYMDPASGIYERKSVEEFLLWWDAAGQFCFLLRP